MADRTSATVRAQWPGRTPMATFVKCLHLLNLDLLDDWPGLTEETFSAKSSRHNLQQRVKGVEWCLYRLFEIYDPDETRNVG